jgi:hypothetical protein
VPCVRFTRAFPAGVLALLLVTSGCGSGGTSAQSHASAAAPTPATSALAPASTASTTATSSPSATPAHTAPSPPNRAPTIPAKDTPQPAKGQSTATASPSPAETTTAPIPKAPATRGPVTGIGALTADWDAHHSPNTSQSSGPDVGIGNREWTSIEKREGRIVYFDLNFPLGTSQGAAISRVLAQFPPDAVAGPVMHVQHAPGDGDACTWLSLSSAILAKALGALPHGNGAGRVDVVLRSLSPTGAYDRSNVDTAEISALTSADDPGRNCFV